MEKMERIKFIAPCLLLLFLFGCYEEKVKEATLHLKIGMTKAELDQTCKDLKFLREQTVSMYPNATETMMRATLWNNQHFESRNPENLIDQLTFDGNIKVYSYLIKREKVYANPTFVDYLAIFHNQKEDRVIGWAHLKIAGDVDTWHDVF